MESTQVSTTTRLAPSMVGVYKAGPESWPFVLSAWVSSFSTSPSNRGIPRGVYWKCEHDCAESCLAHSQIYLVCPKGDLSLYLGFAVVEDGGKAPILHYMFVKEPFRGLGLGSLLVDSAIGRVFSYTHTTRDFEKFVNKYHNSTYNPYLFPTSNGLR